MAGRSRALLALLALFAAGSAGGCATLQVASDYDRAVSFEARETYDWIAPAEEADEDDAEEMERVNPFLQRRLERAVENELDELGFKKTEDGPVDFLVAVSIIDPEGATAGRRGRGLPLALGLGLGLGFGFGSPYLFSPYGFGWSGFYSPHSRFRHGYRGFSAIGYYRPYLGYGYGRSGYYRGGYYRGAGGGDLGSLGPGSFVVDVLDGESGDLIWRGWANGALGFAPDLDGLPDFIASVVHDIMEDFPPGAER